MGNPLYRKLRETALLRAKTLPKPQFYQLHHSAIQQSEEALRTNDTIKRCHAHLDVSQLECAHGICHCEAVARDAGALVLIEGELLGMAREQLTPLFLAAIMAGLLHDIKRSEQNHAVLGSIEAERILASMGIDDTHRSYISYAIRNHEAFKTVCELDDALGCLVSNALYDADKFRWGPENFTGTLWIMVDAHNTEPQALHRVFKEKMGGIERIKETFRTETGRRFGPEFIDQGIMLGDVIFEEMGLLLQG